MKTSISNPVRRVTSLFFAVLLLVAAGGTPVWAQAPGQPSPSEQPQQQSPTFKAGTITIKFVGTANVNEQVVRANMQVREGGDFDANMLDRDLRSLYRTGLFELIEFGPHIPTNKYQARPALPSLPPARLSCDYSRRDVARFRAEACARNRIATVRVEALQ